MAAVDFTERDFYLHQQLDDQRWLTASFFAILVHITMVVVAIYLPSFFDKKLEMEEVIAVNLVSMPEPGGEAAPVAPPPKEIKPPVETKPEPPPPPPVKPAPPPEPAPPPPKVQAPPPPPPETAVPEPVEAPNPISVLPTKKKIKKAEDTRLEEEKEIERQQVKKVEELALQRKIEERQREAQKKLEQRELERKLEERKLEQKKLAEQREMERRMAERREAERREAERQETIAKAEVAKLKAEAEARRAREALAAVRSEATQRTAEMQAAVTQTSSGRQQAQDIVTKQYLAALNQRIKSFWILPESRKWDSSLEAVVVVSINREGVVLNLQFEQRSKDGQFDQLVEKTINSAAPLPRFPALMKQETIEVGLRFRPGELGNL